MKDLTIEMTTLVFIYYNYVCILGNSINFCTEKINLLKINLNIHILVI